MQTKYVIEEINYDVIQKAVNINPKQKSMLFGFMGKFVAVKEMSNGLHILMNTLGKRDECHHSLQDYLKKGGRK